MHSFLLTDVGVQGILGKVRYKSEDQILNKGGCLVLGPHGRGMFTGSFKSQNVCNNTREEKERVWQAESRINKIIG